MTFIAGLLFAVLSALALLHAYWGAGGRWPAADDRELARTVVGVAKLPSASACYCVALVLAATGLLTLSVVGIVPLPWPSILTLVLCGGATLVFLARGLAGYHPAWRRVHPLEPFATYDRRFYAPLCLALGFAYFILLVGTIRS